MPAELKSMRSEDIKSRQWTEEEADAVRRAAACQEAGDDSDIDFEDVPALTEEQLARLTRFRDR